MRILDNLQIILEKLQNDEVIVMQTDTVMGLICHWQSKKAVDKIYHLKKRGNDFPLSVLVDSIERMKEFAILSDIEEKLFAYFQHKITIVLTLKEDMFFAGNRSENKSAESDSIGVRICGKKSVKAVINSVESPIIATSANLHTKQIFTDLRLASSFFNINGISSKVAADDDVCEGVNSGVVKLDHQNKSLKIIRLGGLLESDIKKCLPAGYVLI